tara:strand:- start:194 stop:745 length:552 start_codon:yes stop_codon:yes gene_type:complete
MSIIPPWLAEISSYQKKESKLPSSRYVQLSTIGIDNTPRVRTVVFRGWSDSYKMKIFTDKRSLKIKEINNNQNVEICWYFQKSKCQFRFRGIVSIDFGKDYLNSWKSLNDNAKSTWGWPTPGSIYIEDNNIGRTGIKSSALIDNFILLNIDIFHVDKLLLSKPKHFRKRWILNNQWYEERINP